jgi:tRNA pseudouridine55 synthase
MNGIININKPQNKTSFSVVAAVKRITGEKHTGHAGTLDPLATGVLPVCLGQATRVIEYLFDETKTYRSEVELGIATDTYDVTGRVVRTGDTSNIQLETIEEALAAFRGTILQTPPMYSAVKYCGKPLYRLARSGIEVERKSRPAHIYSLEIVDWQPPVVTLEIVCGKGTYIRSLAHDLGERLGCGAQMKSLVRTKVGPFSIEDALALSEVEEAFQMGNGEQCLYPADYVLASFPALVVNKEQQCLLCHGSPIDSKLDQGTGPSDIKPGQFSRAYTGDGNFLGMVRYEADLRWHPEKIFLKGCCG